MAGFLKKMAGAFVYLDEEKKAATAGAENLDDIARETSELLTQLNTTGRSSPSGAAAGSPQGQTGAQTMAGSAIEMTADDVFTTAGLTDAPGSAQRVLKIIAGLSMFSREQQVVMVRAMDAADESWSEKEVLEDARRRQSALRSHLQTIETERVRRQEATASQLADLRSKSKRQVEEIDRQAAELQKQRETLLAESAVSQGKLEQEKKQTDEAAEKARRGITSVINALSDLITFFVGGDSKPAKG